jgi:hypothetical protein
MEFFFLAMAFFGFVVIYLLPFIVAMKRKHKNRVPIFLVNLLFGWSFIGWGVALVWSFTSNTETL